MMMLVPGRQWYQELMNLLYLSLFPHRLRLLRIKDLVVVLPEVVMGFLPPVCLC